MRILDRSKPAVPSLALPPANQVHDLHHPIHADFLKPQLVVLLGEPVVRRPKVGADGIVILDERKLEQTCRRPGEVIPQQGEVHPR